MRGRSVQQGRENVGKTLAATSRQVALTHRLTASPGGCHKSEIPRRRQHVFNQGVTRGLNSLLLCNSLSSSKRALWPLP